MSSYYNDYLFKLWQLACNLPPPSKNHDIWNSLSLHVINYGRLYYLLAMFPCRQNVFLLNHGFGDRPCHLLWPIDCK